MEEDEDGQRVARSPALAVSSIDALPGSPGELAIQGVRRIGTRVVREASEPDNLSAAWDRVRAAGGAPGVDGIDLGSFARDVGRRLESLGEAMRDGSYCPSPLRAARLPRHIGPRGREVLIPTVPDRVVMRAILDVATPEVERHLLPCSYGYRPGRSIRDAIEAVHRGMAGRPWVLDGDIADFFNSVDHGVLAEVVHHWFGDAATCALVLDFSAAPVVRDGAAERRGSGLPLGTPLSPLLANLVLHPLDRALWDAPRTYIRYADDFLACCATEADAFEALRAARQALEQIGLALNETKTRVVDARGESVVFLGHLLRRSAGAADQALDRPATRTLYLTDPGGKLARRGARLAVEHGGAEVVSVPIREVRKVVVLAPTDLTSPALAACLRSGIDVELCGAHGRWEGRLESAPSANPALRQAQLLASIDPETTLALARAIVCGKLANERRLLQRYAARDPGSAAPDGEEPPADGAGAVLREANREIGRMLVRAREGQDLDRVRGAEGLGARAYFGALASLLPRGLGFAGRVRRPPTDLVNAMLSFGYVILTGEAATAASLAGLDPYTGFLHRTRHGRHSLALDLVEELRTVVVDSVVLSLIRRKMVKAGDEVRDAATGGVLLRDDPRRLVIGELERRLLTLFTYEPTGERVSYRRGLQLQARQVARVVQDPDAAPYLPIALR